MMKKTTTLILLMLSLSFMTKAQTGIPVSQMTDCDNLVSDFLSTYDIPGATFSLAKNGKLVYLRAFGQADISGNEITQPYHLFRIASISKPITSVAIMKMVENGELSLSDQVFGEGGLLENHAVFSTANITDPDIYLITVQNLLEHSAGWDKDNICTPNPTVPYTYQALHCDPIGFPLHVTHVNGTPNPVTEEDIVLFLLEKGLDFEPNTSYAYSNTGYLVLGEIIEELSGLSYEDYVKTNILVPLGIYDMHMGKNLLVDKQEREGEYTGNLYTSLSCYGTGLYVPWEYGGFNIEAMDAHGGWISSARDLVRLLVAVDGFATKPDILSQATIATMVEPSVNFENYAKGWLVNQWDNWWHNGALDGTATLFARTSGGYTFAILLNKRIIDASSQAFWTDLDGLPWNCISSTTSFPVHDLMDLPFENASGIEFSSIMANSVEVNWDNGDGDNRILLVKENPGISDFPLDGTAYNSDPSFGLGDDVGNNTFAVYNGSGNSIAVNGLEPNTQYSFRVFEYNQSTNTGNYPLYMLGNSEEYVVTTATSTGFVKHNLNHLVKLYPSPASKSLTIELDKQFNNSSFSILNLSGQTLIQGRFVNSTNNIDISHLPGGFYYMTLSEGDRMIQKKFVKLND